MATEFKGAYQNIYAAGLARQREEEARRRALLGGAAARAGVSSFSGGAQDEISREAARGVSDLEGRVAAAAEEERLGGVQFERQKELLDRQATLQELAAARERDFMRKQGRAQVWSNLGGAVIGGVGGALAKKYF